MLRPIALAAALLCAAPAIAQDNPCLPDQRAYDATVIRVVDGDTAWLLIELGFDAFLRDSVRFWGINAPERYQEGGPEATARMTELLPEGSAVIFCADRRERDKYGRPLGVIWKDGQDINQLMVDEGHAKEYLR